MALIVVASPALMTAYVLHLANLSLVRILLVVGLNFILGWTGLISLAPAAFFGIGAYASALLTVDAHWPPWLALLVGAGLGLLVGYLLGIPTLRLRSHYFAMATLALAEIVRLVLQNWKALTHGPDGVVGIPPLTLGAMTLGSEIRFYYLGLTAVALGVEVARRIRASRIGLEFHAVRQGELAAQLMGVDVPRAKMRAFLLSALYATTAGSLYAHLFTFISPDVFGLSLTVETYAMLVVGGAGSLVGCVLGAVLLTFLPEWLRLLREFYMLAYGVGIVLVLVFLPYGIVPGTRRATDRLLARGARA